MKRNITVAIIFLSVCFGTAALILPTAIGGEPDTTKISTRQQTDIRNAVVNQEHTDDSVSCTTGFSQPVDDENTAPILPDYYVQAMGTKCVTPHTICDIDAQPINYPCCCPDNTCGYVSQ